MKYLIVIQICFVADAQVNLDPEATHTADLILILDKLFDSLNSCRKNGPPGKPLKAAVTVNSDHFNFWYEAISILETMRFYCPQKQRLSVVPSIKNFITTLKGFIYLFKKILVEYKNKFILVRAFQQDALENLFGCIRNYSGRENRPSALHFITSFKALIANNFMSTHSPGANCEEDNSEGALENLRYFLTSEILPGVESIETDIDEFEIPPSAVSYRTSKLSRCTFTYISGFIARKVLKKIHCDNCRNNMLFREHNVDLDFIDARQYNFSKLTTPGTYFTFLCQQSLVRLFYLIPRLVIMTKFLFYCRK